MFLNPKILEQRRDKESECFYQVMLVRTTAFTHQEFWRVWEEDRVGEGYCLCLIRNKCSHSIILVIILAT